MLNQCNSRLPSSWVSKSESINSSTPATQCNSTSQTHPLHDNTKHHGNASNQQPQIAPPSCSTSLVNGNVPSTSLLSIPRPALIVGRLLPPQTSQRILLGGRRSNGRVERRGVLLVVVCILPGRYGASPRHHRLCRRGNRLRGLFSRWDGKSCGCEAQNGQEGKDDAYIS